MSGYNRMANDYYRAILHQQKTENTDLWGFGGIEIEHEII
jgi:hypothetical protein